MGLENAASGNLSAWLATEVLGERFRAAYKPSLRFFSKIHHDSNPIARSESKVYRVKSDPGAAPAGPGETVALENTYQVTTGTSVTLTSTEFVGDIAEFSIQSIADTLGLDINMVAEKLTNGTQAELEQLLEPYVADMVYRAFRTAEANTLALLSGLSLTVGTTTQDWTLARMLAARYTLRINQPLMGISKAQYWMPEIGVSDLEAEVAATSGGVAGTLWGQQARYALINNPGEAFDAEGLIGDFLGHRVYTIDPEMNVGANNDADVLGLFGNPGVPGMAPDDASLMGKCGAFAFYERMKHRLDFDDSFRGRGGLIRSIWHGAFGEISNNDAVGLVIDAP